MNLTTLSINNLFLAKTYSRYSPDRTKIGAVISYGSYQTVGGYNRLPKGLDRDFIFLDDKNRYIIHAEESALMKCPEIKTNENGTIYIWGLAPCAHCAALIADKGIRDCVAVIAEESKNKEMWKKDADISKKIFLNTGVGFHFYTLKEFEEGFSNAS